MALRSREAAPRGRTLQGVFAMTKPRTLEEIADEAMLNSVRATDNMQWCNSVKTVILAALREAADGEREKCIEIVGLEAANWPEIGAAILLKVQDLLRQRRMS